MKHPAPLANADLHDRQLRAVAPRFAIRRASPLARAFNAARRLSGALLLSRVSSPAWRGIVDAASSAAPPTCHRPCDTGTALTARRQEIGDDASARCAASSTLALAGGKHLRCDGDKALRCGLSAGDVEAVFGEQMRC